MNKFDEFFKSELENHELSPPKKAWSEIQSKLDSKKPIALFWYAKRVGIAAAILLGGYLTFDSLSSSFNSKKHKQEMNEWSRDEEAKSNAINDESSNSVPMQNETVLSGDGDQGRNKSQDSNTTELSSHSQKYKSGSLIEDINARVSGSAVVRSKEEISDRNGSQTGHNQQGIGSSRLTDDGDYPSFKTERSTNKYRERVANNTVNSQKGVSSWNQGATKQDAGYKYSRNDDDSMRDKVPTSSVYSNIGADEWAAQANSLGLDFFSADVLYPIFPTELPDDLSLDIYEEWAKNQDAKDEEEKQSTLKKMDVYAYTSPTRFDALSGNSLPELEGLEQNVSNNLAFGFRAGYALNDRWKIRSGIGMMRISQTTADVPLTNNFFSAAVPQLGGVAAIATPRPASINYISSLQMNMGPTNVAPNEINALAINDFQGDLIQNISYVEIPLEIEYKMIKKKRYDISATAGASTFVLTDNDITADIEGDNFAVGEANNLNSTSVSANVGVRFDVNIKKNIDFTVEPHFKYLMNSVNNNPDFRPYVTGVNAGIRIKL